MISSQFILCSGEGGYTKFLWWNSHWVVNALRGYYIATWKRDLLKYYETKIILLVSYICYHVSQYKWQIMLCIYPSLHMYNTGTVALITQLFMKSVLIISLCLAGTWYRNAHMYMYFVLILNVHCNINLELIRYKNTSSDMSYIIKAASLPASKCHSVWKLIVVEMYVIWVRKRTFRKLRPCFTHQNVHGKTHDWLLVNTSKLRRHNIIFLTICSSTISWQNIAEFWLKFYWNCFQQKNR